MFYEEKWIGEKLFWRGLPDGEWIEFTIGDYKRKVKKLQQQVKSVDLADVVNWLPFKREFADKYKELAKSGKLIKLYDDGTVIRHGEDEPIACVTHFREG